MPNGKALRDCTIVEVRQLKLNKVQADAVKTLTEMTAPLLATTIIRNVTGSQ